MLEEYNVIFYNIYQILLRTLFLFTMECLTECLKHIFLIKKRSFIILMIRNDIEKKLIIKTLYYIEPCTIERNFNTLLIKKHQG